MGIRGSIGCGPFIKATDPVVEEEEDMSEAKL